MFVAIEIEALKTASPDLSPEVVTEFCDHFEETARNFQLIFTKLDSIEADTGLIREDTLHGQARTERARRNPIAG